MLRKRWLALTASALCGWTATAQGQARLGAPVPVEEPALKARGKIMTAAAADAAPALPEAGRVLGGSCADDNCSSGGGIMAGGTVYFLRPYINNNVALVTTSGIGTPSPTQQTQDFDWDYNLAPAAWIGWTSSGGAGVRARYFYFNQDSNTLRNSLTPDAGVSTTISPPPGLSPLLDAPPRSFQSPGLTLLGGGGVDDLSVGSDLRIETIDGEATYATQRGHLGLLLSAGGRYLQMFQNYQATLVNPLGEFSSLLGGHNFYGAGPTLAAQANWKLGNSGLSVYGSARGSFLVGTSRFNVAFSEMIIDPINGNQNNLANNLSRQNVNLPILEAEGGLEYGRNVGRTYVFVRGAVVNHTYFDAGSASSREGNLSLFGGQVSLGVGY